MFAKLRSHITRWIDPEAAAIAAALEVRGRIVMHNQRIAMAQTEALRARGIKGSILDYQNGMVFMYARLQYQNWEAMHTLCLPAPGSHETPRSI